MFLSTKIEQEPSLSLLLSNPIAKKLFCRQHGIIFQYRCIHPSCNAFVCGKIECIDHHFHNNQLKIQKFDTNELILKIKRVEELSKISQTLTPIVNDLASSIDRFKQRSANLFKDYKVYKSIVDYLIYNLDGPLDEDYLSSMEEFQIICLRIEEAIQSLGKSINWRKVWISLEDELEIAQKLKISFLEFKNVYFEIFEPNQASLYAEDKSRLFQDRQCEGIILLYFTHEQYLIGEFVPNNNVDTCQLFIHNFVFVVNNNGDLEQYSTSKPVMAFYKLQDGPNYCIRVIDEEIYEKEGLKQMEVKKVACFYVHAETH